MQGALNRSKKSGKRCCANCMGIENDNTKATFPASYLTVAVRTCRLCCVQEKCRKYAAEVVGA